jgi:peptide/nickel transport system substrate-binding protein
MKRTFIISLIVVMLSLSSGLAMAQSLVVALDTPPRTMNPHGSDADANLQRMANIFDGLLQRKGAEGELAPALAERYERLDDLTWKFYLRKGVKFHNGNPFTAEDVKFSFEHLSNPEVSEFVNTGKTIDSIEIIDDYTVVIKTTMNIPWFANNMHQVFMMDKESTENRDPGDVGLNPIGTGAYKFVEWMKGSHLKLEANEDYWEGAPPIKQIEERPITEASTRFAALVSGQVDLVAGVPVELYAKVKENPNLEVVSRPARRSIFLALNNKPDSPTADLRVRQAIYMAINEEEIIEKIMRGHASLAPQIPDPPTIGYNAEIERLPYDLEKAKALMKEAGYEHGFKIRLSGPNDRYVNDAQIAEAVAKYLAKINIEVELDVKPKAVFFPEVNEGILDFYLIGWFDGTFDLGRSFFKLIHTRDEEKGYGELNGTQYSDTDLDELNDSTADIVDPVEREKVLQKLNKLAMDKVAVIPLHYQEDLYAIQKGRGIQFTPRPDMWMVYKEISKQ